MLSKFGDEDVTEEEQLESLQTIAKSPKLTAELQVRQLPPRALFSQHMSQLKEGNACAGTHLCPCE